MFRVIGHHKKLTIIQSQTGLLAISTKTYKKAAGRRDQKEKITKSVAAIIDGALFVFTRAEWTEGRKTGSSEFLPWYGSISHRKGNGKGRMEVTRG